MLLKQWDELPDFMQSQAVRPYYEILNKKRGQLLLKRCFDIILSIMLIVILSPVMFFLALWIKFDSKGNVFFCQERITQYGKIFHVYKFRTMIQDADKFGSSITTEADVRITNVGVKIRKFRFDELPQLFNVIKGDMSFVGTRPEVRKYVDLYTKEMYATLLLPAGITSKASIIFKDEDRILNESKDVEEAYIRRVLPSKMKINLSSILKFGLCNDFRICIETILEVIR